MRLIRRNIFPSLFLTSIAFVFSGIMQEWFESQDWCYGLVLNPETGEYIKAYIGYVMPNPDVLFFQFNPRLDRLLYWLLNDTAICWLFIALSDEVIAKSYMNMSQRAFAYVVRIYFFAELFSCWWVQFFLRGESYNDWWLQVVCVLIFGYKSYQDERAHNRRSRVNDRD